MKRKPNPQKQYKKDLFKLLQQKRVKQAELDTIISNICDGVPLDKSFRDHPMVKTSPKHYQGCRDFHYKANICVVYRLTDDTVELIRIGSHQDLGLTESLDIFPRGYFEKYKINDEQLKKHYI